jgi:hypothetical protein
LALCLAAPSLQAADELMPSEKLAEIVLGTGCQSHLMANDQHPFPEAQMVCVSLVSFRLVDEILDGQPAPKRRALLKNLLKEGLSRRSQDRFFSAGKTQALDRILPSSVLYRGLLLLSMAGMSRVDALSEKDLALFDSLASGLARDLNDGRLISSFGQEVWPCDHAPAASGLLLHGMVRKRSDTREAGRRLVDRLESLRTKGQGFPNKWAPIKEPVPRGTSMAWTAAMLAPSGVPEAFNFAGDFVDRFCDRAMSAVAACREWPEEHEQKEAEGSGPILFGFGTGATALGIAATKASPQLAVWHRTLRRSAKIGGLADVVGAPEKYPLENAIMLWGSGIQSWAP